MTYVQCCHLGHENAGPALVASPTSGAVIGWCVSRAGEPASRPHTTQEIVVFRRGFCLSAAHGMSFWSFVKSSHLVESRD